MPPLKASDASLKFVLVGGIGVKVIRQPSYIEIFKPVVILAYNKLNLA